MGTCTSAPQVADPHANASHASESDNDDDIYPSYSTESEDFVKARTSSPLRTLPDSIAPPRDDVDVDGDASLKKGKATATHILDLPKQCLVEILCRVGGNAPLPIRHVANDYDSAREEHLPRVAIVHPLQCALVCKRWRALTDAAVSSLTIRDLPLTDSLANDLGHRFPHLAALSFASADIELGEPLLALARRTPLLQHLELRNMMRARSENDQHPPASIWPKDLGEQWPLLRSLLLSRCGDPLAFGCFPHLESLRIHSIGNLPTDFGSNLPSLRKLELAYGRMRELPPSLGGLTSLQVLNLHNCPSLSALPETIGSLVALREMCIHACGLLSLPEGFRNLTRLEVCELSDLHSLRELPEGIGDCYQLANLEITGCSLDALPEALGRLSALEHLLISNCDGLLSLPKSFGALHSLRALRLKDCKHLIEYVRRQEVKEVLSTLPECQVWVGSGDTFRLLRLKR